jgi:hypothetical protein
MTLLILPAIGKSPKIKKCDTNPSRTLPPLSNSLPDGFYPQAKQKVLGWNHYLLIKLEEEHNMNMKMYYRFSSLAPLRGARTSLKLIFFRPLDQTELGNHG